MKREDLTKLGVAEDLVDQVMALHGKGVEKAKADLATANTELEGLKKQLADANSAIEGFKKLDVDGIKAAADEWKAKAEAAQAEAQQQVQALKFDHALEQALSGAKARNPKAVRALLDVANLKLNEADGSVIGLDAQLKQVKEANEYLFESDAATPKIVAGGNNKSVMTDAVVLAARKAAGLPVE